MQMLRCPECNSKLTLKHAYSGADWMTEAGEGSGYGYELYLSCTNSSCANVYTIGYTKSYDAITKPKNKPYL